MYSLATGMLDHPGFKPNLWKSSMFLIAVTWPVGILINTLQFRVQVFIVCPDFRSCLAILASVALLFVKCSFMKIRLPLSFLHFSSAMFWIFYLLL